MLVGCISYARDDVRIFRAACAYLFWLGILQVAQVSSSPFHVFIGLNLCLSELTQLGRTFAHVDVTQSIRRQERDHLGEKVLVKPRATCFGKNKFVIERLGKRFPVLLAAGLGIREGHSLGV